jgi:formamidopyrimidine-DNA glycosylase
MPELPEVERVRLTLEPHLVGKVITRARLLRADYCESIDERSRVRRTKPSDLLECATIARLDRRGKQIAMIATDGRALCFHLGMSGQVLHRPRGGRRETPSDHVHVVWTIAASNGTESCDIIFRDPRRFGGVWTFPNESLLRQHRWAELGPDALSATGEDLLLASAGSRRALKAMLLDQSVLAGVGNIYADEALHVARLAPQMPAGELTPQDAAGLAGFVREILARSIALGGSSLRDYVDAEGMPGANTSMLKVYGRAGEACLGCGTTLERMVIGQRTTVWCPRCQAYPRVESSPIYPQSECGLGKGLKPGIVAS